MGGDRGGWYSHDWLDNNGKPSADRIVPEWQHLQVGQRLSRVGVPGQEGGSFTVVTLEPEPDIGAQVELRLVHRPGLRSAVWPGTQPLG